MSQISKELHENWDIVFDRSGEVRYIKWRKSWKELADKLPEGLLSPAVPDTQWKANPIQMIVSYVRIMGVDGDSRILDNLLPIM